MKISNLFPLFFTTVIILITACGGGEPDGSVIIKYDELRQEIDGFGGSDAWLRLPQNPFLAEELAKLLYSRTEGVGFTVLRTRIPFRERLPGDDNPGYNDGFMVRNEDHSYKYTVNENGTKSFELNWNGWDQSNTRNFIKLIQDLGESGPEKLTIKAVPWTPPNNRVTQWKEDVKDVSNRLDYQMDWSRPDLWGRLKRDKYNDYADLLADFVLNYEANMGSPLDILSIQNEPNWKVEYESCYWSGEDLRDFLKTISVRFPMKGIQLGVDGNLGIMAPEYENFNVDVKTMIMPMLDDPISNSVLTHIGLHQYNSGYDSSQRAGSREFPEIIESGKKFWQTEVSGSGPHLPPGTGIENAMHFARMIHFNMTWAETNAYLFWWLWQTNPSDEHFQGSLINLKDMTFIDSLRLYAIGQYSRFIRPGWHRIESVTNPVRNIYSSAYRSKTTDEIAIVVINDSPGVYRVSLDLEDIEFSSLEIYRTSSKNDEKLKRIGKQRFKGNSAIVRLEPNSITTFYGRVK